MAAPVGQPNGRREGAAAGVRDPFASTAAILAARERPMSERLELALSWNAVAAELCAGLAAVIGSGERPLATRP